MNLHIDHDGTAESFKAAIDAALGSGSVGGLMVLTCDGNGFRPAELDPILKAISAPVFGGVFPSVFCNGVTMNKGSVVVAFERPLSVIHVPNLSSPDTDFEEELDAKVGVGDFETLVVFLDGLSSRIKDFIDALYTTFGLEMNYVGGGAGSASLKSTPCLITNDGLKSDGVIMAGLDLVSGIGVRHGWSPISGPYQVTESTGNALESLDWHPAFDVYKAVVEEHSGQPFDELNFFEHAIAYPFGIAKMGAETLVRDPVALNEDRQLVCVGDVSVGEYVDILHGEPDALVEATAQALQVARDNFPDTAEPGLNIFIDCLSRALFLREQYGAVVDAALVRDIPAVGVCSLVR